MLYLHFLKWGTYNIDNSLKLPASVTVDLILKYLHTNAFVDLLKGRINGPKTDFEICELRQKQRKGHDVNVCNDPV